MNVLAIGAHPDDIEIFMFGFLKLCQLRGDKVSCIIATDGAKGGKKIKNLNLKRSKETISALKQLTTPIFLGLPDGYLGKDNKHLIVIDKAIKKIKPDLIITHYKEDYHSDHKVLSQFVDNSSGHYIPIIYCDTMMGINFDPDYYVDITSVFKCKLNAISYHVSQSPKRFSDLIKIMNSYRAAQCNAPLGEYAEAYKFKKSFPFSDIRKLLPPSPKIRPFHIDNQNGFL